jgi:hypothetical protein
MNFFRALTHRPFALLWSGQTSFSLSPEQGMIAI